MAKTLYDKIWDSHLIEQDKNGEGLIYIDRQLINEVTSPQAYQGLYEAGRSLWRPESVVATADHNTPTLNIHAEIPDQLSREQVALLTKNIEFTGARHFFPYASKNQGILHVVSPELGLTQPGMTIACGDSHTSTHGALAVLAFGIGTSEIEHILATQSLWLKKFKNYGIYINGQLNQGVYSKDIALYIIQNIGSAGAVNHVIEYLGDTVHQMSIEARMTLCNMAVEAGARTGIIAVDDVTIEYLRTLPFSPIDEQLNQAIDYWRTLYSDDNAKFDRIFTTDATQVVPMVTWGTSPDMACSVNSIIPYPEDYVDPVKQKSVVRALQYMGLESGSKLSDLQFDKVFIGSCTNSRIEDLRIVANIVKDKKIASTLKQALIVPGSGKVKAQAELEGLDKIFLAAGFEWRSPGCSMCLGMNDDHLNPKERCASTSNRNFEGRQGAGGRTHLMSPATAAATAIHGVLTDPRRYIYETI